MKKIVGLRGKDRYDLRPLAIVQTGDFTWTGKAETVEQAIIAAFAKEPPDSPSILVRCKVGGMPYQYMNFGTALKIAGYSVRAIKRGLSVCAVKVAKKARA